MWSKATTLFINKLGISLIRLIKLNMATISPLHPIIIVIIKELCDKLQREREKKILHAYPDISSFPSQIYIRSSSSS